MTHATKAIYRWLLSDYIKVRYRTMRHWNCETQKDYECVQMFIAILELMKCSTLRKTWKSQWTKSKPSISIRCISCMHNFNSPIIHTSIPCSSIPGGGCEWNQVLVLQRRPCAGCGYVHDRDCRCEDFLHWRLLLRGRQTLNGCRDTLSISGCLDLCEFKVAV